MSNATICHASKNIEVPCVNRVDVFRPLAWLRLGLADLAKAWPFSIVYGVVFAVVGYFLVNEGWGRPHLAMTLTSGFLLVAPFLAAGFYDLSLRSEHQRQFSERLPAFASLGQNLGSIALFGLMLAFMFSVWERISAILVGLYLGSSGVPEAGFSWLFSSANFGFLLAYIGFGLVFALVTFAISAVSLPMMMHRPVDIVTAVVTSLWAVWENRLAMLFWMVLIVLLVAAGVATAFIGLIFTFPLLGHATWHAYRELVQN